MELIAKRKERFRVQGTWCALVGLCDRRYLDLVGKMSGQPPSFRFVESQTRCRLFYESMLVQQDSRCICLIF